MKHTLNDLNAYLFDLLDALTNQDLTDEELDKEINRSKAITQVASTIIQNGDLALKTIKAANECGLEIPKGKLPMLGGE